MDDSKCESVLKKLWLSEASAVDSLSLPSPPLSGSDNISDQADPTLTFEGPYRLQEKHELDSTDPFMLIPETPWDIIPARTGSGLFCVDPDHDAQLTLKVDSDNLHTLPHGYGRRSPIFGKFYCSSCLDASFPSNLKFIIYN